MNKPIETQPEEVVEPRSQLASGRDRQRWSDESAYHQPEGEEHNRTRQEDRDKTDINKILARLTPEDFARRNLQHGEVDTTMDLHDTIIAARVAQEGFLRLSEDIRNEYPSLQHVFIAMRDGALVLDERGGLVKAPPKPPEKTPNPNPEAPNNAGEPKPEN